MQCKVCGTFNEDYMEFCKKCASELPRENLGAPERVSAQLESVTFDPQPYDYRLPYRPGRGVPQGYERPPQKRPVNQAPEYFGPRPAPSRELPVRPAQHLNAQMPPLPMPQGRVVEAPIVRIPEPYYPERPQSYAAQPMPQQNVAPQQATRAPMAPQQQAAPRQMQPLQAPAPEYNQYQQIPAPEEGTRFEHEDAARLNASHGQKKPKPPKSLEKRRRKAEPEYDDYEGEPDDDEFDEEFVPRRGSALSVILYVSIALLFLAAVWFAGNYINDEYGGIGNFVQTVFGNSEPENPGLTPADKITVDIEKTTREDAPAHRLRFHGEDGQQIELIIPEQPDYTRRTVITSGVALFMLMDNIVIPEKPDDQIGETLPVKLEANLIDKDGQVYALDVPEFTIDVPPVTLTLTSPQDNPVTVDKPELLVEGKVSANASLKIDGEDVTGLLDALGNFSYTKEFENTGNHTITVEAAAPRSRPAKEIINVSYKKREVELKIDPSVPTSTTKDTIEIKGTMEKSAAIAVSGSLEGDPVVDSEAGTFSFVGKLEVYGLNQFIVTASKEDASSDAEVSIEKKPDVDQYSKSARAMDYASLAKNPNGQLGRVYVCDGKVQKLLQEDPFPVFVFNVGGSKEQLIVMEYYGTTKLDESKSYRIYGDVAGMDEEQELPKLIARFVYDKSS